MSVLIGPSFLLHLIGEGVAGWLPPPEVNLGDFLLFLLSKLERAVARLSFTARVNDLTQS